MVLRQGREEHAKVGPLCVLGVLGGERPRVARFLHPLHHGVKLGVHVQAVLLVGFQQRL